MPRRLIKSLSIVIFTAMASSSAWAASAIGTLMVVKGKVWVVDQKGKKKRAKIGKKIKAQDTVKTEKDSRAKVVMLDKNIIHISPDTEMKFSKYEFDPKKDKKDVLLDVIYGKVRSNVQQKYDGKKQKFQVKTKAAVAGVRGTDFLSGYSRKSQKSQFVTFGGVVEVGKPGRNGAILNPVRVAAGQFTSAGVGGSVDPPKKMSPKQLNSLKTESGGSLGPDNHDGTGGSSNTGNTGNDSNDGDSSGGDNGDGSRGPDSDSGGDTAGGPDAEGGEKGSSGENKGEPGGDRGPSNEGPGDISGGDSTNDGGGPSGGDGPVSMLPGDLETVGGEDNRGRSENPGGPNAPDVRKGPIIDPVGGGDFLPPPPPRLPPQLPRLPCPPVCADTINQGKTKLIIDIK